MVDLPRMAIRSLLLIDFGLDEPCEVSQRVLPAEITSLGRNDIRDALLHDMELRPDRYFLQGYRHLNIAGQVGIIELVRVTQALVGNELDIFAAKRMALARREISKRHFERAADAWLEMMHGAGKAIGRKPFRECVRLEKRAIDLLRPGCEDAMQAHGVGHDSLSFY